MFCVTFLLCSAFGYVTDGIVKMSRFDVGIAAQQSISYSIIPSKSFGFVIFCEISYSHFFQNHNVVGLLLGRCVCLHYQLVDRMQGMARVKSHVSNAS